MRNLSSALSQLPSTIREEIIEREHLITRANPNNIVHVTIGYLTMAYTKEQLVGEIKELRTQLHKLMFERNKPSYWIAPAI